MDSSFNTIENMEQTVQEVQQLIGEINITQSQSPRGVDTELKRIVAMLLKVIANTNLALEDVYSKLNTHQPKRASASTKKDQEEIQLDCSLIRPECRSLLSGMSSFTMSCLKNSIKNRFEKGFLRTDLDPSVLGITQQEYSIHQNAMLSPDTIVSAINEKDIPTLAKRVFEPVGTYRTTVTSNTGDVSEVELDLSNLVGVRHWQVIDELQKARWLAYGQENKRLISPYLLTILAQVPILKQHDILNEVNRKLYETEEGCKKLLDQVIDTHEIYYQYKPTPSGAATVESLDLPIINGFFKLETVGLRAKERKIIKSVKDTESIKNTLTDSVPESNLIM